MPELVNSVINLVKKESLREEDFLQFNLIVSELGAAYRANMVSREELQEIARSFSADFLENTMQGYGLRKPFGYAGDFLMIDKIYTLWHSENKKYKPWDDYFHQQAAPKAVRNRKKYFIDYFLPLLKKQASPVKLLNVASGPARDLFELYNLLGEKKELVRTTCVDLDKNAIQYASDLLEPYRDQVDFIHKNIFRFQPQQKFDFVWSAGLFDYFNDKAFCMVLCKLKQCVIPGGEIIIGNFNSNHNPSRDYMEIFGEWFLIHRSPEQLTQLALEVGFLPEQITVNHEPEQVNLFLHLKL